MLWGRGVDADDGRALECERPESDGSSVSQLRIEMRLEAEEDGQIVYSRRILQIPRLPALEVPLGELSADLDAGRRIGAGGFVALDFETATSSRDSACAVAVAAVDEGRVTRIERWLIQPPGNDYDGFNIGIHGITPEMTEISPSFGEVWPEVLSWIDGRPLVAHYAPFDLSVLRHSLSTAGAAWPELIYYCTCALARRAWPGRLSYRLPDLANECGVGFQHHEPGADAAAAGELAIACCGRTNTTSMAAATSALGMLPGTLTSTSWSANGAAFIRPSDLRPTVDSIPDDSPFKDKTVVFTGTLTCGLTRKEAQQLVVNAGGKAAGGVSKKVDYLVLGIQDAFRVADGENSGKMLKAAELRAGGCPIELLAEDDFLKMLPG